MLDFQMSRLVDIGYLVRASAFAYSFLGIGLHLWERHASVTAFVLLALQFIAYPQLAYAWARRSRDPRQAELANQYADSVMLGAWSAALGFPVWIVYGLCVSTTLNAAVNRGAYGAACSLALFGVGILGWIVPMGFSYWLDTSPLVTAMAFFGSLAYVTVVGCVSHAQRQAMRAAAAPPARSDAGF
jgi:hypothetical protein